MSRDQLPTPSSDPALVCRACGCGCGRRPAVVEIDHSKSRPEHSESELAPSSVMPLHVGPNGDCEKSAGNLHAPGSPKVLVLLVPASQFTGSGGAVKSDQILAFAQEVLGNPFLKSADVEVKSLLETTEIDPATVPLPPSPPLIAVECSDTTSCLDLAAAIELPEAGVSPNSTISEPLHTDVVQENASDQPMSNQDSPSTKSSPASRLPEASPDMYRITLSNLLPTATNDQIYSLTFPYSLLVRGATFYPPRPTEPGGPMARSVMFGFRDLASATKLATWMIQEKAGGRLPELIAPFGFANISPVMPPVLLEPELRAKDSASSQQNGTHSIDLDLAERTAKAGSTQKPALKSTPRRPIASIITDSDHRLQMFNLLATRSEADIMSLVPEHIQLTAAVFQPPTVAGPNRQLKQSVTFGFANGEDALACYHWIQNLLTNGFLADYLVAGTRICAAPPLLPKIVHPRPESLPARPPMQPQPQAPAFQYPMHMSFQPQPQHHFQPQPQFQFQPQFQSQRQHQPQPPSQTQQNSMWPYSPTFPHPAWAMPVHAVQLQPVGVYYPQQQVGGPLSPTSPTYFAAPTRPTTSHVANHHVSQARPSQPPPLPSPPSSTSSVSPQPNAPVPTPSALPQPKGSSPAPSAPPPPSDPAPPVLPPPTDTKPVPAATTTPISPPITPTVAPAPRNPAPEQPDPAHVQPEPPTRTDGSDLFGITVNGIDPSASVSAVLAAILDPVRGRVHPVRIQQTGVHPFDDEGAQDAGVVARGVRFVFDSDAAAKEFVMHVFTASLDGELRGITAAGCRLKVVKG